MTGSQNHWGRDNRLDYFTIDSGPGGRDKAVYDQNNQLLGHVYENGQTVAKDGTILSDKGSPRTDLLLARRRL